MVIRQLQRKSCLGKWQLNKAAHSQSAHALFFESQFMCSQKSVLLKTKPVRQCTAFILPVCSTCNSKCNNSIMQNNKEHVT